MIYGNIIAVRSGVGLRASGAVGYKGPGQIGVLNSKEIPKQTKKMEPSLIKGDTTDISSLHQTTTRQALGRAV